jgi:hypothetical protein
MHDGHVNLVRHHLQRSERMVGWSQGWSALLDANSCLLVWNLWRHAFHVCGLYVCQGPLPVQQSAERHDSQHHQWPDRTSVSGYCVSRMYACRAGSAHVPLVFAACMHGRGLYLFNNQLSGTIPSAIGELTALTYVDSNSSSCRRTGSYDVIISVLIWRRPIGRLTTLLLLTVTWLVHSPCSVV